jgi:uncharacterized membrane protein YkvA (DUF1232 family)
VVKSKLAVRRALDEREVQIDGYQSDRNDQESWLAPLLSTAGASPSFLKLFARLAKDPRVNIAPKLVILGVLAYVVLPTDLVPDFIPGLGYADDVAVLLAGLKLFLPLCPPEVVQEHLKSIAAGK